MKTTPTPKPTYEGWVESLNISDEAKLQLRRLISCMRRVDLDEAQWAAIRLERATDGWTERIAADAMSNSNEITDGKRAMLLLPALTAEVNKLRAERDRLKAALEIAATAIRRDASRNAVWLAGEAIHAKAIEDALAVEKIDEATKG